MTSSSNQTPKPILVRKYGGSSLASVDRIKSIANDIHTKHSSGFRLVIVVSAMGQTTNELAALANEVSPTPSRRELDMLLSVG
ncbi:aspartate kinase, partial [bacterium]|nr:aspartate kinase [bacterium]